MTFPVLLATVVVAASTALVAMFKYLTAREALKDVPSTEKPAVLNALGVVFEKWRR